MALFVFCLYYYVPPSRLQSSIILNETGDEMFCSLENATETLTQ